MSLNVTDLNSLRVELEHLARSLANRNGHVLEWESLSYDIFPEIVSAKSTSGKELSNYEVEQALTRFYSTYVANETAIVQLETAVRQSRGDAPWHLYTPDQLDQIDCRLTALHSQNEFIAHLASACMEVSNEETCMPHLERLNREVPKPDREFAGVAPWQLYIASEPGDSKLLRYIGVRPEGKFARHFHIGAHVVDTDEGLFALVPSGRDNRFVKIGDVETDDWGVPHVCVKEFASACNLRIVERRGLTDPDGLVSVKLILTMFDEAGYVARTYEFLPSP